MNAAGEDLSDGDPEWQPQSTFWLDVGWASTGLVPAFVIPFLAGLLAPAVVTVFSVVFCGLALAVFALLSGEAIEDWWDDFKLEHRIMIFGLIAALVVPIAGAVAGSLL